MQQLIVFAVIGLTLYFFIDGRFRYEFVSLSGLLILTISGVLKADEAFLSFGHPAVITVASVLVISAALIKSGIIESIVSVLNKGPNKPTIKVMALMALTAAFSGFMNNVGALALILPVALKVAKDSKVSPSKFLMPVAFASLLGGMVTVIGTPPNLIVSNYRQQVSGQPFAFFEFAPIGIAMVLIGILFTIILGMKLIPDRKTQSEEGLFNIGNYLSEVIITEESKIAYKKIIDFYLLFKVDVEVLSITRDEKHIIVPKPSEVLLPGDVLIIKTDSQQLTELVNKAGLTLKGAKLDYLKSLPSLKSEEFSLVEVVLRDDSLLIGRTAIDVRLRNRFNVNLVAVSRKGVLSIGKLKTFRFKAGDVLLLQAPVNILQDIYNKLSFLPLAERKVDLKIPSKKNQYFPLLLFVVGILITVVGILPVQVAFTSVAVILVLSKNITAREFYDSVEWPTIILLGSLLPMGTAIQKSGADTTIANLLMHLSSFMSPGWMLVLVMVITMATANLINTTATAVLMGPVALTLAGSLGVSPDPFLIAVCIASSSAFLTPIGHQSNMLVMGPGGYKFTDYLRLGLPLSILIISLGTPIILFLWPL